MKTVEQLEAALSVKKSELVEVQKKIANIQAWMDVGIITESTEFVSSVFTEKAELKDREKILKCQIEFLKWTLEQ